MTKSHKNDNDDDDFKHVCMIAVFLLVRLLYLLIHSLNHLFRLIQTLMMLADFINLIAVSSLIACCLSNLSPKLTFSQQQKMKSEFPSVIMFNLKNKIVKKCLQHHVKLLFMKSAKEDFYQEACHIAELIIVKKKLMNINMKNIFFTFSEIYCILKFFMQTLNVFFTTA